MKLKRMPKVLTFDCYGTLVDWEGGQRAVFAEILSRKGSDISPEQFRERWEPLQFHLIQGEYQRYPEILKQSFAQTLASFNLPYEPRDGEALAASMPTWAPFPEVPAALVRLRTRCKLGIITNTDNDIIAQTVRLIGVDFDGITTAMDAGVYKPSLKPFRLAYERLNVDPADVLHIAFGFHYDIGPAQQLGCQTLWVNRKQEPLPGPVVPDYICKDFHEILELFGL